MADTTLEPTVVALLDWQGRLVWTSREVKRRELGLAAFEYVRADQREMAKAAVEAAVTRRKQFQMQVVDEFGDHYRVWVWPLDSPDVAVCALAIHVPEELALLTSREQDCLKLLGYGVSPTKIAAQLRIGVSTVHTHLRRAREKLKLPSLEALISFAARHCGTFSSSPMEHAVEAAH